VIALTVSDEFPDDDLVRVVPVVGARTGLGTRTRMAGDDVRTASRAAPFHHSTDAARLGRRRTPRHRVLQKNLNLNHVRL
jgi:hypothetical protein